MSMKDRVIKSGNPAALSAFASGDIENALVASTPGGIEAQEAQGQRNLTRNFTQLPKDYLGADEFPTDLLKRLGFTIQAPVDEIFIAVTVPDGWQLRPTEHSMHNDIVDDKGRIRGGVFYKAAFYDRRANFNLNSRFFIDTEYQDRDGDWEDGKSRNVAKDRQTGELLSAGEWIRNGDRDYKAADEERAKVVGFLNERCPDWKNVEAYW